MTAALSLIDRARGYVAKIPGAITGEHGDSQTLAVANVLVWDFALSPAEALTILREYNQRCSPPWSEAELGRKLQSAEKQPHAKPRGNLLEDGWRAKRPAPGALQCPQRQAQIDPATAIEKFLNGFRAGEADVWEASPIRPPDDYALDGICLLQQLYQPGEIINFVTDYKLTDQKNGTAKPVPMGRGLSVERNVLIKQWLTQGMPQSDAGGWLRMNPVDGQGVADANITSFRFILLEFDAIPLDLQLALLTKLPLPIAIILTSGGRSLHAWAKVDCQEADEYRAASTRLLNLLFKFGLDAKNKNPSRLSRLVGVNRALGAAADGRQRILYLNPDPSGQSIL